MGTKTMTAFKKLKRKKKFIALKKMILKLIMKKRKSTKKQMKMIVLNGINAVVQAKKIWTLTETMTAFKKLKRKKKYIALRKMILKLIMKKRKSTKKQMKMMVLNGIN